MKSQLHLIRAAALFGALGIAFGAFGAHALRDRLGPERLNAFEVGVRYLFYHALALLFLALAISREQKSRWLQRAGVAWIAGIILFSGSLFALALSGWGRLGLITPFGGIALLAGWLLLLPATVEVREGRD